MSSPRRRPATVIPPEPEAHFQAAVVDLARRFGWSVFHTFDSRNSAAGFPDLFLCRPPRALAVELKTETGKVSADQALWLAMLGACGIETATWRPSHKQELVEVLR